MRGTLEQLYEILENKWQIVSINNLYLPISIPELSKKLSVSPITIRKNLHILESQDKIKLEVHSGKSWIVTLPEEE